MKFKKVTSAVAALCLLTSVAVQAQSLADLKADGAKGENVLTYGMGQGQQRFSKLKQINKSNVKKLQAVWSLGLENEYGEQAQPMIQDGVMYISNAKWTMAVDGASGKMLWRTAVDFDPDTPRVVCCGISNRGVALFNGMVFRGTLDAYMVALDQKTGKELWKTKVMEWKDGYSITGAPLVANGVVITGHAGAEFGVRGFIAGYDAATGKELWRRHTTAAPGEKGGDTWPVKDSYKNGGASTWITGSYDADLDLVYWGTGNTGPWNPNYRGGDSLYAASVIAVRPSTGELVWHYQFTPNDIYDYDAVSEMILGDLKVDGKPQKVLMQLNRNGFSYVLDRANGKLLSAQPYERVNWAKEIDLKTGRPVETEVAAKLRSGETAKLWPNIVGPKNWYHAAFDQSKGLVYTNLMHFWSSYKLAPLGEYKPGTRWVGVQDIKIESEQGEPKGYMAAIDPVTGKRKWEIPLNDHANWSSMIATAGGLLFTGRHTGEFMALDADTGKTLWQFQMPSGVTGNPVTWSHKGKQYVTMLAGTAGIGMRWVGPAMKTVPKGGTAVTFALPN